MERGKLSISIAVNGRPRVIYTVLVAGSTFEEIRERAAAEIEEFKRKNERLVVCDSHVQVFLWV